MERIAQKLDERYYFISDLNFAIYAMFTEHGIEIPFPQRVVHLRPAAESRANEAPNAHRSGP